MIVVKADIAQLFLAFLAVVTREGILEFFRQSLLLGDLVLRIVVSGPKLTAEHERAHLPLDALLFRLVGDDDRPYVGLLERRVGEHVIIELLSSQTERIELGLERYRLCSSSARRSQSS